MIDSGDQKGRKVLIKVRETVFWPASVRLKSFPEHVEAAAAGGFTSMAIAVETYDEAIAAGMTVSDIKALAEDNGVPLRHLDTCTAWASIRVPSDAPPEMVSRFDVSLDRTLDACEALGITNILATAGYPMDAIPQDELVRGFSEFCKLTDERGMWVDLEFMPFLGMPDLASAWSILEPAAPTNAGLMIDTWHFAKSGSSLELLRSIPGHYLRSVQLSDGFIRQRGESLLDDTLSWREFPGQGELPVLEILQVVAEVGQLTNLGQEVFSERANAMDAIEVGRQSRIAQERVMAEAGIELTTQRFGA